MGFDSDSISTCYKSISRRGTLKCLTKPNGSEYFLFLTPHTVSEGVIIHPPSGEELTACPNQVSREPCRR